MTSTSRSQVIRDASLYSIATSLSLVLNLATGLIVARQLGPLVFGIWTALQVLLQYSQWTQLGVLNGLAREMPRQRGQGHPEAVQQIQNIGGSLALTTALVVAMLLLLASELNLGLDPLTVVGLRYLSALVVVRQAYNFLQTTYRSHLEFTLISGLAVANSVAGVVVKIPSAILFGFHGFMIANIAIPLGLIAFALYRKPLHFRLQWDLATSVSLLKVGFPIWLAGVVYTVFVTLDRTLIGLMLGVVQLGYYGLTSLLRNALAVLPIALSEVLYPRLSERYGEAGNDKALRNYVVLPMTAMACIMPFFLGVAYVMWPVIVTLALANYVPGIRATQIYILGFYFSMFTGGGFLLATNRQYLYLWFIGLAVMVSAMVTLILVRSGWGIEGAAVAVGVGSFVSSAFGANRVLNAVCDSRRESLLRVSAIVLTFVWLVVCLIVLDQVLPLPEGSLDWIGAVIVAGRIIFLAICNLPLWWYCERQTRIFSGLSQVGSQALVSIGAKTG